MVLRQNVILLMALLSFLSSTGTAQSDILFNGTNMYLATGESATLYQGYVLTLKSVSGDGSMWLQLADNDTIIKSEIVYSQGSFVYNRTNKTIISLITDKVYSGPSEQQIVSFFMYQYIDPDKPVPDETIIPENTVAPDVNGQSPGIKPPNESMIWILGIIFILIVLYIARKLW